MAEKGIVDIKGPLPAQDTRTATFSDLSLTEAIDTIMRGCNYALMDGWPGQKPLLLLVEKILGSSIVESSRVPATPRQTVLQVSKPRTSFVPSIVVNEAAASVAPGEINLSGGQVHVAQETPGGSGQTGSAVSSGSTQTASTGPAETIPGFDPNYKPGGPGYVPIAPPTP